MATAAVFNSALLQIGNPSPTSAIIPWVWRVLESSAVMIYCGHAIKLQALRRTFPKQRWQHCLDCLSSYLRPLVCLLHHKCPSPLPTAPPAAYNLFMHMLMKFWFPTPMLFKARPISANSSNAWRVPNYHQRRWHSASHGFHFKGTSFRPAKFSPHTTRLITRPSSAANQLYASLSFVYCRFIFICSMRYWSFIFLFPEKQRYVVKTSKESPRPPTASNLFLCWKATGSL